LFSSVVECLCSGELKPMPAGRALRRALGRRRRFDCARFRSRDFENSLTACVPLGQQWLLFLAQVPRIVESRLNVPREIQQAGVLTYSWPYWSSARWTAPNDPRPISCFTRYWLMRCWAVPSSSLLLYSDRALKVSCGALDRPLSFLSLCH
jgi:hypothetical protein